MTTQPIQNRNRLSPHAQTTQNSHNTSCPPPTPHARAPFRLSAIFLNRSLHPASAAARAEQATGRVCTSPDFWHKPAASLLRRSQNSRASAATIPFTMPAGFGLGLAGVALHPGLGPWTDRGSLRVSQICCIILQLRPLGADGMAPLARTGIIIIIMLVYRNRL